MKKKEKHQYYTEEQIWNACDIIEKRVNEIMSKLGSESNLIGWLLNPRFTAPCEAWPNEPRMNIGAIITHQFRWAVPSLIYDGNLGYDIQNIAEAIEKGEI